MKKIIPFIASAFLFLILSFGFQKNVNTFIMYPSSIAKKKMPIENRIQGWSEERAEMTKNIYTGKVEYEDRFRVLNQINSQSKLNTRGADIAWESRGPNNVGGRTCGFVFDNQNINRCYAGGVSGGVFVSDNMGLNWRRAQFENNEILAVSVGSMKQSINGDIYVGTGEYWGNTPNAAFGSQFYGNGIYKLTAGESVFKMLTATRTNNWTVGSSPAPQFRMVIDIATHPTDNNKVYAATDNGLMISSDGGTTWKKGGGQSASGVIAQIKIAPNGTDLFIGSNGRFWKSTNDGTTWTQIANSYSAESNQHVRIAISSLDDKGDYIIYACGINSGNDLKFLIKSEDKGTTWQMLGKAEGIIQPLCSIQGTTTICQGWYDMCLAVNPKNNDQVYLGGMQSLYTWSKSNGWIKCAFWNSPAQEGVNQVHSDMHEFAFHKNSDTMVVCTDGGIFMSLNATSKFPLPTWVARNLNYNVTQFYDVQASVYGELIGGAQDNGTQFVSANGSSSWDAYEASAGDGFDCGISRSNDSKVHFYTVYEGTIKRSINAGASAVEIVPGTCADGGSGGVAGVSFHTRIHHVESTIYYTDADGVEHDSVDWASLLAFDDNGGVFVSPTAHLPNTKVVWSQRNAWGPGKIYCAAHSKNADIIYLGGQSGVKKITGYRSAKFTDISSSSTPNCTRVTLTNQPVTLSGTTGTIGGLYVDRNDPKKVVATQIGFGGTSKVFYSSDGSTFVSKHGNLPSFPVYSCVIDEIDPKHVLVGTEYGVWETDDITVASPIWKEQNIGIGRVPVFKMRQVSMIDSVTKRAEGCPVVYLGTHGNGFYRAILHEMENCNYKAGRVTKSTSGINTIANVATKFTLFPNPASSSDKLNVQFNSKAIKEYEISIYDAQARLVKREKFKSTVGKNVHQTDISAFIDGTYFVRIEDETSVVAGDRVIISNK